MIIPDVDAPETRAALAYMAHKGYPDQPPLGVEVVQGPEPAWYFYFEVPEGLIELEVAYEDDAWWCSVATFLLYDDHPEGWSPSKFVQQRLGPADSGRG